jgi:hypothetical protein
MIVGGEDSSKGLFVTEEESPYEEPKIGTELLNETSQILYVAPQTIQDSPMKAQVIASAWELMWWKKGETGGANKVTPEIQSIQDQGKETASGLKLRPLGVPQNRKGRALEAVMKAMSSWCPVSQVVVENLEPELVIALTDKQPIFSITKEPRMPEIKIDATLNNVPAGTEVTYKWKMTIKWVDEIGSVWTPEKPFEHESSSHQSQDTWNLGWNGLFVGGDEITVEAAAIVGKVEYKAKPIVNEFKILGDNPDKLAAIADLTDYKRAVMYHESRYRQFWIKGEPDKNGRPTNPQYPKMGTNLPPAVKDTSADYGIMQLNSQNKLDLKDIWNWVENKAMGMKILDDAYNLAYTWPERIRENDLPRWYTRRFDYGKDFNSSCSETFGTNEQIWKEAYRRYNGGSVPNGFAYWAWVPADENDISKGGHLQRISYGDKRDNAQSYADEVWHHVEEHPKDW